MEETLTLLSAVKATLNTISVAGVDNMDKLVGCAHAIDTVIKQLSNQINKEAENG